MSEFWRNCWNGLSGFLARLDWSQCLAPKSLASLAALVFGLNYIANLPPQSPENFRLYLEREGYSNVNNIAPRRGYCTKLAVMYSFTATNAQGRTAAGEACMTYSFVYSIREITP